ncbi:aminopeptidase P family protein [Candidatus Peregrinibacteria bacterium]|nr:aminopeptidase P family protein [Candidatus Peregrinibacteria bacterium]
MLKEIRKKIKKFSALLVMKPENIFYLTGFTGSRGLILITNKNAYFYTDFRYFEYAKKTVPKIFKVQLINKKWKKDWSGLLKKLKIKSLGIEENFFSLKQYNDLKKLSKGVKLKESKSIIEALRETKSEKELMLIKKAQQINEKVLNIIKRHLKAGVSEKQIEWLIIQEIHNCGGNGPSFNPIVAFGNHTAIPHHQNTDRKLKKGHVVLIDMGVKYKNYCSDMTRTYFTAKPTVLQKTVYAAVLDAQKNSIKMIQSGITHKKVINAAIKIIKEAGYLNNFQHGLGHGVGLEIHEAPNLTAEKSIKLKENMVMTIEPGIYLENNFGVRIEDMVKITRSGHINLTKAHKELENAIINI